MVTSIPSYQDPEKAAAAMCHFSLDMIDALKEFNIDHPENKLDLRVGINTGHVVAGVVGTSRFVRSLCVADLFFTVECLIKALNPCHFLSSH